MGWYVPTCVYFTCVYFTCVQCTVVYVLQIMDDISCEGLVSKEQLKTRTTVHFTSDGTYIYWLYTVTPPDTAGKNDKDKSDKSIQELVYLETIVVKVKFF